MTRKSASKGPTPVEAITHNVTRANIPTADAHDLVSPEVEQMVQVVYPRELRSPMLVWKGKEVLDDTDLQVDAPPLYIQEKIDPRVLIENLRKTAREGELEPELTLFETFDGLGELDLVEFYKHSANWSNRMILGDSLQVMASLAERERLRGQGPDDLHRPPIRHQVRVELAGVRTETRGQGRQRHSTFPGTASRSRRSATRGSSGSTVISPICAIESR